jgi:integrase
MAFVRHRGDAKSVTKTTRGDAKAKPVNEKRKPGGDGQTAPPGPTVNVRRAKVLDAKQFEKALKQAGDYAEDQAMGLGLRSFGADETMDSLSIELLTLRIEVILRLSFQAGLRAREIAWLRWNVNVLDAERQIGDSLHVTRDIGKRSMERTIPLAPELRKVLKRLYEVTPNDQYVVFRLDDPAGGPLSPNAVVQFVKRYFKAVGFIGCTSHSGRRTFITTAARLANLHNASLKDVQELAGHKHLGTTAKYIEPSDQQRKLVSVLFPGATGRG